MPSSAPSGSAGRCAVVDADRERYERFRRPAIAATRHRAEPAIDAQLVAAGSAGKSYSVARLAKASLTFAGGAEYIVWKINRHAGTDIVLKPWQRRHPLLAAISLLPRLLKCGAVR